jgi:hypothetical protein
MTENVRGLPLCDRSHVSSELKSAVVRIFERGYRSEDWQDRIRSWPARTMIPTRRSGSRRKCARAMNETQKKALPGSKFPVPPAAPCLKLSTEIPVGFLFAMVMPQVCDSGAGHAGGRSRLRDPN